MLAPFPHMVPLRCIACSLQPCAKCSLPGNSPLITRCMIVKLYFQRMMRSRTCCRLWINPGGTPKGMLPNFMSFWRKWLASRNPRYFSNEYRVLDATWRNNQLKIGPIVLRAFSLVTYEETICLCLFTKSLLFPLVPKETFLHYCGLGLCDRAESGSKHAAADLGSIRD